MEGKRSLFVKGHVPWNKGKKTSLETRIKLSQSHKGKVAWNKKEPIEIVCLNCSKNFYVQPHRNIAKFCSKKCHDLYRKGSHTYRLGLRYEQIYGTEKTNEIRKKLSSAKKGRKLVERWGLEKYINWRERMKETFSGPKNPNFGKAPKNLIEWSKSMKGKTLEEMYGKEIGGRERVRRTNQLRKLSKRRQGKTFVELFGPQRGRELLENMSKNRKRLWKEGKLKLSSTAFRKGQIPFNKGKEWEELFPLEKVKILKDNRKKYALTQIFPKKSTLPEVLLYNELENRKIEFKKQCPILNLCRPDAILESLKIAIFADGDYFHANPSLPNFNQNNLTKVQLHNIKRDKVINQKLHENGWVAIRFWESDIKRNVKECVDKIEEKFN